MPSASRLLTSRKYSKLADEIRNLVWCGFETNGLLIDSIIDLIADEVDEDEYLVDAASEVVDLALEERRKQAAAWTADGNDPARLDAAFEELRQAGIATAKYCGLSQTDGWAEMEMAETDRGGVFFHEQDSYGLALAEPVGIHLSFGANNGGQYDAAAEIGREIVTILAGHGLQVEWAERADRRITLTGLRWRRRLDWGQPGDFPDRADFLARARDWLDQTEA